MSELDIHLLTSHSLPGVNVGYIMRGSLLPDHLRKQQERISKVIIDSAKSKIEGPDLALASSGKAGTPAGPARKGAPGGCMTAQR